MRVRFSERAKADLTDIGEYYSETGGSVLARRMVRIIRDAVLPLGEQPLLAPVYDLAPGLRRLVVARGAFLVFYRVSEHVEILHVRRAERVPLAGE